jgi:hypothetical protein
VRGGRSDHWAFFVRFLEHGLMSWEAQFDLVLWWILSWILSCRRFVSAVLFSFFLCANFCSFVSSSSSSCYCCCWSQYIFVPFALRAWLLSPGSLLTPWSRESFCYGPYVEALTIMER